MGKGYDLPLCTSGRVLDLVVSGYDGSCAMDRATAWQQVATSLVAISCTGVVMTVASAVKVVDP